MRVFGEREVCVCMCTGGVGSTVFTRSSRLDPYGHTGVLGSGRYPIIAGPRCRPGVFASLCCVCVLGEGGPINAE